MMLVFPAPIPSLRIRGIGDTEIPADAASTVLVQLSAGQTATQNVLVEGRHFDLNTPLAVTVALTPDRGDPVRVEADLSQTAGTGADRWRFASIPCPFPVNERVVVHVWKR